MNSIRIQLIPIILMCYLVPTLLGRYMGNVFFADLREKAETVPTASMEQACMLPLQNISTRLQPIYSGRAGNHGKSDALMRTGGSWTFR